MKAGRRAVGKSPPTGTFANSFSLGYKQYMLVLAKLQWIFRGGERLGELASYFSRPTPATPPFANGLASTLLVQKVASVFTEDRGNILQRIPLPDLTTFPHAGYCRLATRYHSFTWESAISLRRLSSTYLTNHAVSPSQVPSPTGCKVQFSSSSAKLPLAMLRCMDVVIRLASSFDPPSVTGTTWSTVAANCQKAGWHSPAFQFR